MSNQGRPNRQYNTAKQETRDAEEIERMQDIDSEIDTDETPDLCDMMGKDMFDAEEWE
jgi:hypothetical protein